MADVHNVVARDSLGHTNLAVGAGIIMTLIGDLYKGF